MSLILVFAILIVGAVIYDTIKDQDQDPPGGGFA